MLKKKKKRKRQDLVFHSTRTIQDVDGRALRSQGVKEKKKRKKCVYHRVPDGIGHSFKRQDFFFFFFFNHVDILPTFVLSALSGTTETVPRVK